MQIMSPFFYSQETWDENPFFKETVMLKKSDGDSYATSAELVIGILQERGAHNHAYARLGGREQPNSRSHGVQTGESSTKLFLDFSLFFVVSSMPSQARVTQKKLFTSF